jgi:hypothetical protein
MSNSWKDSSSTLREKETGIGHCPPAGSNWMNRLWNASCAILSCHHGRYGTGYSE